uniref:Uncharacterized protein n=1 Tax=Ralstonia solanacearum TaxID=305 RepID=A0A0S4U358_RALSL|nr:protein of unknown function [Ralstonia solanacearum]
MFLDRNAAFANSSSDHGVQAEIAALHFLAEHFIVDPLIVRVEPEPFAAIAGHIP